MEHFVVFRHGVDPTASESKVGPERNDVTKFTGDNPRYESLEGRAQLGARVAVFLQGPRDEPADNHVRGFLNGAEV